MENKKLIFRPMAVAYLVTIVLIRSAFLLVGRLGLPEPKIIFAGIHIHHYLLGITTLFLVAILAIDQKFSKKLLASFLGVGFALIIDEFQFLLRLSEVKNSTLQLETMAIFGSILVLAAFVEKIKKTSKLVLKSQSLPSVSVVIPAYNEEAYLGATLQSLKKQSYHPQEIIVVDNNSIDKTAQIAQKFGAKVVFEPKVGVGRARQKGFEAARGQIIATTDADTIVPKDWLQKIATNFAQDRQLNASCGLYLFRDGPFLLKTIGSYLNLISFILFNWYSGTNFAVKRQAFIKTGGFNTSLNLSEDTDLGRRLKKLGKTKYEPFFLVATSGRRFYRGILIGIFIYTMTYLKIKLAKEKDKVQFIPIRNPQDLKRFNFIPATVLAFVIFLSAIFFAPINPAHAKVENVTKKFEKTVIKTVRKGSQVVTWEMKTASKFTHRANIQTRNVNR